MAKQLKPVSVVQPGHRFSHYNNVYQRATPEEIRHHPARGCWDDDSVVYAYSGTLPVVFQAHVEVVVER